MNLNLRGYGDTERVKADAVLLGEIIDRQGHAFIIDVIAERLGRVAIKLKLENQDIKNVTDGLCADLRNAIAERT